GVERDVLPQLVGLSGPSAGSRQCVSGHGRDASSTARVAPPALVGSGRLEVLAEDSEKVPTGENAAWAGACSYGTVDSRGDTRRCGVARDRAVVRRLAA